MESSCWWPWCLPDTSGATVRRSSGSPSRMTRRLPPDIQPRPTPVSLPGYKRVSVQTMLLVRLVLCLGQSTRLRCAPGWLRGRRWHRDAAPFDPRDPVVHGGLIARHYQARYPLPALEGRPVPQVVRPAGGRHSRDESRVATDAPIRPPLLPSVSRPVRFHGPVAAG